jgi:hypothetical protein
MFHPLLFSPKLWTLRGAEAPLFHVTAGLAARLKSCSSRSFPSCVILHRSSTGGAESTVGIKVKGSGRGRPLYASTSKAPLLRLRSGQALRGGREGHAMREVKKPHFSRKGRARNGAPGLVQH